MHEPKVNPFESPSLDDDPSARENAPRSDLRRFGVRAIAGFVFACVPLAVATAFALSDDYTANISFGNRCLLLGPMALALHDFDADGWAFRFLRNPIEAAIIVYPIASFISAIVSAFIWPRWYSLPMYAFAACWIWIMTGIYRVGSMQ